MHGAPSTTAVDGTGALPNSNVPMVTSTLCEPWNFALPHNAELLTAPSCARHVTSTQSSSATGPTRSVMTCTVEPGPTCVPAHGATVSVIVSAQTHRRAP